MTFEDLLQSCATGKMPEVECTIPIPFANSNIGKVTGIKSESDKPEVGLKGCYVLFPGISYALWFNAHPFKDTTTRYMHQLKLVK